jgi:hypothetical protein
MFSERYRLRIILVRLGFPEERLDHYYVVGRKPAGGLSVRVQMPEHFEFDEGDTLIFDFTPERLP